MSDLEELSLTHPIELTPKIDMPWGKHYLPKEPNWGKKTSDLRVAFFGSGPVGMAVLARLISLERQNPGCFNLVGIATDYIDIPEDTFLLHGRRPRPEQVCERLSLWQNIEVEGRGTIHEATKFIALNNGVQVYTGPIGVKSFSGQAGVFHGDWRPDLLISASFGQTIAPELHEIPPSGFYEIYLGDLVWAIRQEIDPIAYSIWKKQEKTRLSCVTTSSRRKRKSSVVGTSPWINIKTADGNYPSILEPERINALEALHMRAASVAASMVETLTRTRLTDGRIPEMINFDQGLDAEGLMSPIEVSQMTTRAQMITELLLEITTQA